MTHPTLSQGNTFFMLATWQEHSGSCTGVKVLMALLSRHD
jgi:hypothetical protein